MQALIEETEKMWRVCAANVRDAAVTASIQRIIHYKIAGYGAIASYAKSLGREEDAQHFAQLAARDKAVDAELSELAKGTLNPEAAAAPLGGAAEQSARTH
jgi:ferritin-like metal-binding protein YciE